MTKIPAIPRPAPHRQTQSTIRSSYIQKRRHVAGSAFQNSCAAMRAHWLGANEALIFRDHNLKCTSLPSSEDASEKRPGAWNLEPAGPVTKNFQLVVVVTFTPISPESNFPCSLVIWFEVVSHQTVDARPFWAALYQSTTC